VDAAVKQVLAAEAQSIAVNRPAAAFAPVPRGKGGGQLFNISVEDPAELVKLGGLQNVRGLGIRPVGAVPVPALAHALRGLLHGEETDVFADAAYQGAHKRPGARKEVRWHLG
jgi:hypothetical protein